MTGKVRLCSNAGVAGENARGANSTIRFFKIERGAGGDEETEGVGGAQEGV